MRTFIIKPGDLIPIGRAGENQATEIRFDVTGWAETFGAGAYTLVVKRPHEDTAYPVEVATEGDYVVWTVSNVDTGIAGNASVQLRYVVDGALAKSVIYTGIVGESLDNIVDPPDPFEDLIQRMVDLTERAEAAAEAAAGSAGTATTAAEAAQTAKTAAETAAGQAQSAKEAAQASATTATQAKTAAQTAQTAAEAAKSAAAQSATAASGSATAAAGSATQAAASATAAEASAAAAEEAAATLTLDDTLTSATQAAQAKATGDRLNALTGLKIPIPFKMIPGGYIRYANGEVADDQTNAYTDYIDISAYKQILFKRTASTASNPSSGTAFYNVSKDYVSGLAAVRSQPAYGYFGELVLADVPENAKYVRFTGWADTTTYGVFELYGINENYVRGLSYSELLTNYNAKNNVVPLGGNYVQKVCGYGYSNPTRLTVERYGNKFILSGTTTTSTRIKITNDLTVATTNSAIDGFPNPIKFKKGHTYTIALSFTPSETIEIDAVTVSVYAAGTHASAGTLRLKQDGNVRTFTADQENYHIIIYVNNGTVLSNFECNVLVVDETGAFAEQADTVRIYDSPDYGTSQGLAVIDRTMYVTESNGNGGIVKVDLASGTKTRTSLALGHCNDITVYNGKLYVVGMEDTGRIYIIDPTTLTIDSYVDFTIDGVPAVSFGITYDRLHNQFILEVNDDFVFADTSLTYKSKVTRQYLSGAEHRQGVECDGYYLYCPECNRNNIVVYDYAGALVDEIIIPNSDEPEGLFFDWAGSWLLLTNIPSHEWYVDVINIRNKLGLDMICSIAKLL